MVKLPDEVATGGPVRSMRERLFAKGPRASLIEQRCSLAATLPADFFPVPGRFAAGIPRGTYKPAGSVLRVASALRVRRVPPVARDRCQAAIGAALSERTTAMINEISTPPFDGPHSDHDERSPSPHLLDELALHGYRPFEDESDPHPLPSSDAATLALESVVEALSGQGGSHWPRSRRQ